MIRCLWHRQDYTIIDIKLGNYDTNYYKYESMYSLLDQWETINKDNHGKHCHYHWKKISVCYFC